MQLFGFRDQKDLDTVLETFDNNGLNWEVKFEDRDRFPGFPAAAVSILNRVEKTITFNFLSTDEVGRVAAVIEGRVM